jgi:NAD(P)-dependent dehydrogenase (short-subunit alcohol dehydrogenase family)
VAIITGAARGLGAVQARLFAREGAAVGLGDILAEEGHRQACQIIDAGGRAYFVPLDVTREEDWERAVDEVERRFGGLHVLVNNAGITAQATLTETVGASWDSVMAVNAKGVFLGIKHVIPAMQRAGGGSIVNVSSTYGLVGAPRRAAYGASKGAVRLLTKTAALEYARDRIRANSIHPGPIQGHRADLAFPDADSRARRMAEIPMRRFGTPEEVAQGALFLASDESSYMTGSELVIDGGETAW